MHSICRVELVSNKAGSSVDESFTCLRLACAQLVFPKKIEPALMLRKSYELIAHEMVKYDTLSIFYERNNNEDYPERIKSVVGCRGIEHDSGGL